MAKVYYRCSKCRTRHAFLHDVGWYRVKRKCKAVGCGHRHFYPDRERNSRESCKCDGAYHWGAHRPGSPYCLQNPQWRAQRALRDGADDGEIAFIGVGKIHEGEDIPF